jgi:hypothetical protein
VRESIAGKACETDEAAGKEGESRALYSGEEERLTHCWLSDLR